MGYGCVDSPSFIPTTLHVDLICRLNKLQNASNLKILDLTLMVRTPNFRFMLLKLYLNGFFFFMH